MKYAFIDIETTGLDPTKNHITEISAVRTDENGEVEATFSTLVKLPHGEYVPEFITKLTGIDDDMLDKDGVPIEDALTSFAMFVQDATVVAQFAPFDFSFLEQYGAFDKFYDTRTMSYYLDPVAKASLKDLAARYGFEMDAHHRALSDAITARDIFFAMKRVIESSTDKDAFAKLSNTVGASFQRKLHYIPAHTKQVVEFHEDGRRTLIDFKEEN